MKRGLGSVARIALVAGAVYAVSAQDVRSMRNVVPPEPPQLGDYVRDGHALTVLGKVFFWEMQAGSDGRTACATCHFHAGADHRPQNQIADPNGPFPVNLPLSSVAFPLRQIADPNNRGSAVLRDTSNRIGSAGIISRVLVQLEPGLAPELAQESPDAKFQTQGLQVRRVTGRNAPTVINSVFHVSNFWDGRANRVFNGLTPSGQAAAGLQAIVDTNGVLSHAAVRIENSSLASQAVGPAMDHVEMSYSGRTWPLLAKKLFSLRPLGLQRVSTTDSLLGNYALNGAAGLRHDISYQGLIQDAFQPAFWQSTELFDATGTPIPGRRGAPLSASEFTQMEHNFSLFWGLAIQAYEATLISNDSRVDRFLDGDRSALTADEQAGMNLYNGGARCDTCHGGAETTAASFTAQTGALGNGIQGRAFRNTGVRPRAEDDGNNGQFKTSHVRDIEFTGPYFHNGGQATLEQVIDFYVRAGDFGNNQLRNFNANSTQRAQLVAFLKALSDDRVRYERAPFDHPELCVPTGHTAEPSAASPTVASEHWAELPATGAQGNAVPLQTFEEMLKGIGNDGSRAHHMTQACGF